MMKQRLYAILNHAYYLIFERKFRLKYLYSIVLVATLLLMVTTLGIEYIRGDSNYWQSPNYDTNAHVNGWLFYSHDSWHFPLFFTDNANTPGGMSIIHSDSIPLFALPAKVIHGVIPGNWHYFGFFVILSYIFTALSIQWLLSIFGIRTLLGVLFSVVLACFTSLHNLQFESLFAHFLIIISLGMYFIVYRKFTVQTIGTFLGIVLASLLIHPYLFAICAAIYSITIATICVKKMISIRYASIIALLSFFILSGSVVVSGHLNSFAKMRQPIFFGTSPSYALDITSLFKRTYSVDEITTYIGLGVIILSALAFFLCLQQKKVLKRHSLLLVLLLLFFIFSLSSTLYINGNAIFHINLPSSLETVLDTFRVSKRFIIPIYYALAIAGFILAFQQKKKLWIGIAAFAIFIQIADNSYYLNNLYKTARSSQERVLPYQQWNSIVKERRSINIFPSYSCMFEYPRVSINSDRWKASLEFIDIAAKQHLTSNSARTSRRDKDCDQERVLAHAYPINDSISIYLKDDFNNYILDPSPKCKTEILYFTYGGYCKSPD